jgi:hypothetical protein
VFRRVTSASSVSCAGGSKICRYKHVICGMLVNLAFPEIAGQEERPAADTTARWPGRCRLRDVSPSRSGSAARRDRAGDSPARAARPAREPRSGRSSDTDDTAEDSPSRGVLRCSDRPSVRSLPAETVEFPVSHAAEKSMPLVRGEPEDRPLGVSAVANADFATGQARHLDAVAVGIAQRALNPVRT